MRSLRILQQTLDSSRKTRRETTWLRYDDAKAHTHSILIRSSFQSTHTLRNGELCVRRRLTKYVLLSAHSMPRNVATTARAIRRALTSTPNAVVITPSFYACPTERSAMDRWMIIEANNEASNDIAVCRASVETTSRAPRPTLWCEEDEATALPSTCGVIRDAFPIDRGDVRGRVDEHVTKTARARGRGRVVVAEALTTRARPNVVDVYERTRLNAPFVLKRAGVDVLVWLRERGVSVSVGDEGMEWNEARTEDAVSAFFGDSTGCDIGGSKDDDAVEDSDAGKVTQCANECVMIVPSAFASNEQAARDNHFMSADGGGMSALEARRRAVEEFKTLFRGLQSIGVRINLFSHDLKHDTPDAVFPNNWHTVRDGKIKLFPMKDENRRRERREDVVEFLKLKYPHLVVDDSLLVHERSDPPKFLEGTGSLVIDHLAAVAFVALSERAHPDVVREYCDSENLKPVVFTATDAEGRVIYHTNVMMSIGTSCAIVCLDSIADKTERRTVVDALAASGKEIVDISRDQVNAFCGNVLEVRTASGEPALALSRRALDAFTHKQRETLDRVYADRLVVADFDVIETVGGGGVRCSIAEVFP